MTLRTSRLEFRPVELNDAHTLFTLYADPRTSALSPLKPIENIDEMRAKLLDWQQHWQQHGFGPWLITERASKEMIGIGGLSLRDFSGQAYPNLWYRLSPNVWGQGYATEFVEACIVWFRQHFPALEIHALVQENNPASRRILEKMAMHMLPPIRYESSDGHGAAFSLHYVLPNNAQQPDANGVERHEPEGVSIRPLQEGDFEQIMNIQAACYGDQLQEDLGSLRAKWEASPSTCFVGQIGDVVCAYVFAIPTLLNQLPAWNAQTCNLERVADCLYLHDIAVLPMARGKGLSQQLLQSVIQRGVEQHRSAMQLVAVQNSVAFWRKQGFELAMLSAEMSEKLRTYGADAVIMTRSFEKSI